MISDLENLKLGAVIEADICIVGGGAAGISMALNMLDSKLKVIVLEAGGEDYEDNTQDLYRGDVIGRSYYALDRDRLRQFGGTTNHWGGWCTPLAEIDLTKRDWVPYSGWPIEWQDLEPHYPIAQDICGIGKYNYSAKYWFEPEYPILNLNESFFKDVLYQFSEPLNFGSEYKQILNNAKNVNIYLHANLTNIICNDPVSKVTRLKATSLSGKEISIISKKYILACGGIENPRILLSSNQQNKLGLGNDKGLVGRYFMDHLEGLVGHIIIDGDMTGRWLNSYEKRILSKKNVYALPGKKPSNKVQREKKLLNISYHFSSIIDSNSGYSSARRLVRGLMGKRKDYDVVHDGINILKDIDEVALWIHHRLNGTNYEFPITNEPAKISVALETAPNPDSRVILLNEKDKLGMQKIALDWRVGNQEKYTLSETTKLMAAEISRTTGMRVKLEEWLLSDDSSIKLRPGHHHMGTTRMGWNSSNGVVDKNCKVFGISNLYVAGSSIFPTVGYANPTLTIVALATRLAKHLKSKLDS